MQALWLSFVRTIVPLIVGWALGLWAGAGIEPDPEFAELLGSVLTLGFTGLYYVVVRLLETYVSPKLGWLLGAAKAPLLYSKESPRDVEVVEVLGRDRVPGPDHRAGS